MNNDDNTIELPKRIDGESNPPENNQNIQSEDNIKINNVVENKVETNVAFPSEKEINHENTNNKATEPVNVNIFDQSIDQNINTENHESESLFEPIKDIENVELPQNENEINVLTTPESPKTVTITPNPAKKPSLSEDTLINDVIEASSIEDNNNQLNKKIVSVEPVQKEKNKGNPIIGFFALLLILAIILTAFYYFIKMDYIILPDEIKNKIPFFSTTTTTSNNNKQNNNEEELSLSNLIGEYTETSSLICPDIEAKLLLNQDNTFSYKLLSFDEENNKCDISEITGNYLASNGNLKLTPTDSSMNIGTANYQKVGDKIKIDILKEEKKVTFTNID